MEVRVRFAPSPTGRLHVGGARTALFNWLFARNKGGKFLLRIEDTDLKRSSKEMEKDIKDSLLWLGLAWDEEILYQSRRFEIYRRKAEELVEKGCAYYSYTEEDKVVEVDKDFKGKPLAIRFRVPKEGETSFKDIIRGKITFKNEEIEDFVILRSDGSPTYYLACVIDDHYMGITHVIRGEEHIPNTPKQILIYNAFGWKIPSFAHLPMILGYDKRKLSKRHGATAILDYKEEGILPEALVNFLALLGWSPGGDREIITIKEMIELFRLEKVGKRGAVFDVDKLLWMNSEYIRMRKDEDLFPLVAKYFEQANLLTDESDYEKLREVIPLLKVRVKVLKDFVRLGEYFFKDDFEFEREAVSMYFKENEIAKLLHEIKERLLKLEDFEKEKVEACIRNFAQEKGIKAAQVIHPLRVSLTGRKVGPGLFELMSVLGKEECVRRIDRAIRRFF